MVEIFFSKQRKSRRNEKINLSCISVWEKTGLYYCQQSKVSCPSSKSRPITSLGHQVGRRILWEGPKLFKLCPIVLNYVQHIFPSGDGKNWGALPPPWLRAWEKDLWKHEELVSVNLSEFTLATVRPVTKGEKPPLEKNFWHSLKILDTVQIFWAPLRKIFPPSDVPS